MNDLSDRETEELMAKAIRMAWREAFPEMEEADKEWPEWPPKSLDFKSKDKAMASQAVATLAAVIFLRLRASNQE